jgi:F-type H+-transporting ATPase subunit a
MEGRLFTFFGAIGGHGQEWIILSHLALTVIVVFLVAKAATRNIQLVPTGAQNVMEAFIQGVITVGSDTMGKDNATRYMPLIATLGFIIFIANMMGIVPGFESVTGNINFTLSLAILVFIYYNYLGFKENGAGKYLGHMMGPVPALAPLMFPIEVISHISRIVSLSFRLFGSIKGDDMFLMVLLMLVPWIAPLPGFFFLFAFGILQAFIFMMLTYVYIAGSIMMHEEEH